MHIDGQAVRSCSYPVSAVGKRAVTTLERLGNSVKPSPLQQAFIDEQAARCGYCINGMVMQAADLLKRNPKPTEAQIREGLTISIPRFLRRAGRRLLVGGHGYGRRRADAGSGQDGGQGAHRILRRHR